MRIVFFIGFLLVVSGAVFVGYQTVQLENRTVSSETAGISVATWEAGLRARLSENWDPEWLRLEAGAAYKLYPQSAIPVYYLALAAWHSGNREGAFSYLDKAASRALASERDQVQQKVEALRAQMEAGRFPPEVLLAE